MNTKDYSDYTREQKLKTINSQLSFSVEERETLLKAFLKENHLKFIGQSQKLGTTEAFIEDKSSTQDEIIVVETFKGEKISFNVRLCKLTYGPDNKYHCTGIVTDRVRLPKKGVMGGFGSHDYIDEAAIMEQGILKMADKHNLMLFSKACSWPYAIAIIDHPTDKHLETFKEKGIN